MLLPSSVHAPSNQSVCVRKIFIKTGNIISSLLKNRVCLWLIHGVINGYMFRRYLQNSRPIRTMLKPLKYFLLMKAWANDISLWVIAFKIFWLRKWLQEYKDVLFCLCKSFKYRKNKRCSKNEISVLLHVIGLSSYFSLVFLGRLKLVETCLFY